MTDQTPAEKIARTLAKPTSVWLPPTSARMFRYRVSVTLDPNVDPLLAEGFSPDGGAIVRSLLHGPAMITHTADTSRIELAGKSRSAPGPIFIRRKGQGALYLDGTSQRFLQTDEEQMTQLVYRQQGQFAIDGVSDGTWQGQPAKIVSVSVGGAIAARAQYTFLIDPLYAEFRAEMTRVLFSCSSDGTQVCPWLLPEFGIPVEGRSFYTLVNSTVGERPVSIFQVSDLEVLPFDPAPFVVPPGYADFRDKSAATLKRTAHRRHVAARKPVPRSFAARRPQARTVRDVPSTAHATPGLLNTATVPTVHTCQCLPGTYGARAGLEIEQELLDLVRTILNSIAKRLNGFSGKAWNLKVDWFDQFKKYSDNHRRDDGKPLGDLVYCLLHEDDLTRGKEGELDVLAETFARRDLAENLLKDLSVNLTGVDPDLVIALGTIYADTSIAPEDRFDHLPTSSKNLQVQLREVYLRQKLAEFNISYKSAADWFELLDDFIRVRLSNLEFDFQINDPTVVDPGKRNGILTALNVASGGQITLTAVLKGASGKAEVERIPGGNYWLTELLAHFLCGLVPGACEFLDLIETIAHFFLFDFGSLSIEISDISIDGTLDFIPDTDRPDGSLVIKTTLKPHMTTVVHYDSFIPDGVSELIDQIAGYVVSHVDAVMQLIADAVAGLLDGLLKDKDKLDFRIPPEFLQIPNLGLSETVASVAAQYLYFESTYDPAGIGTIAPFLTLVDPDLRPGLAGRRQAFKDWLGTQIPDGLSSSIHIGGFALSQNFLNYIAHLHWRNGHYDYQLSGPETDSFKLALGKIVPAVVGTTLPTTFMLCPPVSPRIMTTALAASSGHAYLTTFFDDLRLCMYFGVPDQEQFTIELRFSAEADSEIGFGGFDPDTRQLSLAKLTADRFLDIYFDVSLTGTRIVDPEIFDIASNAPDYLKGVKFGDLTKLQDPLREIVRSALSQWDRRFIPRDAGDPPTIQRYPLFGSDKMLLQLDVSRGDVYVQVGEVGALVPFLEAADDPTSFLWKLGCQAGRIARGDTAP